jgi:hypothetical protein
MRLLIISVALVLANLSAAAEETTSSPPSVSPLLVLLAASDDTAINVERQLVAELRLTLDGVQVEQIAIERPDFLTSTLPEQLEVVQPLIRRFMARAAVWVVTGGRSGHLIQFVVSDRGNATIRTVNAGSAEELALAVRELLDSAYLFDPKPRRVDIEPPPTRFSLGGSLGLNGGIVDGRGPTVLGGAAIQARLMPVESFLLGLQVAGKLGPRASLKDGLALGWRTEFALCCGYRFRIEDFYFGPYAELSLTRSSFNAVLEKGEFETHSWWSFRGALGLELSLNLSKYINIFVDWTFGGIVNRRRFRRASNGSTIMSTPVMDYAFTLGLASRVL